MVIVIQFSKTGLTKIMIFNRGNSINWYNHGTRLFLARVRLNKVDFASVRNTGAPGT